MSRRALVQADAHYKSAGQIAPPPQPPLIRVQPVIDRIALTIGSSPNQSELVHRFRYPVTPIEPILPSSKRI